MTWIVARTKPSQELVAATHIRRQGHSYYLPRFWDDKLLRRRPLFPCYIFVDIKISFSWLTGTQGIAKVLMFGECPATVQEDEINKWRDRENVHGNIVLEQPATHSQLNPGDKVRLMAGAMVSELGIYQGMSSTERCVVMLRMLNQQRPVTIDRALLEPV